MTPLVPPNPRASGSPQRRARKLSRAANHHGLAARHPELTCTTLLLLSMTLGVLCRFVDFGLPGWLVKYGGSCLWAIAIFWLFAALRLQPNATRLALLAGVVATAIEFFKLVHAPIIDSLRLTLPGILLLGRYFAYPDILVYWAGIALAAALHHLLFGEASPPPISPGRNPQTG